MAIEEEERNCRAALNRGAFLVGRSRDVTKAGGRGRKLEGGAAMSSARWGEMGADVSKGARRGGSGWAGLSHRAGNRGSARG